MDETQCQWLNKEMNRSKKCISLNHLLDARAEIGEINVLVVFWGELKTPVSF